MRAKLKIADRYADMNSMPYIGSRFLFKLPSAEAEEGICPICNLSVRKELNDMKILVAEDDKINFLVISHLLKNKVKKVDRALNGREAVELAKVNEYDLIFMDMNMPLMGGVEATKIIKKMYPFLPIIAQTAFSNPDEKFKFLKAGCDDVILKPIRSQTLTDMLLKYATN